MKQKATVSLIFRLIMLGMPVVMSNSVASMKDNDDYLETIKVEEQERAEQDNISDSCVSSPQTVTSTPKKRKRTISPNNDSPALIKLVKQKPSVKSPFFVNSSASIYAAVCNCDSSLLQTLVYDNIDTMSRDDIIAIVNDHFGACPTFKQTFEAQLIVLQNESSTSPSSNNMAIEQALHTSVRHLCSNECFLRAYLPVREYCMLWRDLSIDESIRETKDQLLHEWRCILVPPVDVLSQQRNANACDKAQNNGAKKTNTGNGRIERSTRQVRYISPSGVEHTSKANSVKHMNRDYFSKLKSTPSTTPPHLNKNLPAKRLISPVKPVVKRSNNNKKNAMIHHTAAINPLFSPLGLLEELFVDNPWRLLVSTICLNVTTRGQVDHVLHAFLDRWPTAEATANADWKDIHSVISSMGLGTKRAKGLVRFSVEYINLTKDYDAFHLSEEQVTSLFFCGMYSWSAYNIFIRGGLPPGAVRVCDHALQLYVEYQLGRRREC